MSDIDYNVCSVTLDRIESSNEFTNELFYFWNYYFDQIAIVALYPPSTFSLLTHRVKLKDF